VLPLCRLQLQSDAAIIMPIQVRTDYRWNL
jgi:hypothetical protein